MSRDYESGRENSVGGIALQASSAGTAAQAERCIPRPDDVSIRWDRVRQIREALQAGLYFVPAEKVAEALLRRVAEQDRLDEAMYPSS